MGFSAEINVSGACRTASGVYRNPPESADMLLKFLDIVPEYLESHQEQGQAHRNFLEASWIIEDCL